MRTRLKLALVGMLLLSVNPCWALSKGALTGKELDYFNNVFDPMLVRAHICTQADGDCVDQYIFCDSEETLSCDVYGITDKKLIKALFYSMLNSGLNISYLAFHSRKYHEISFRLFEKPLLQYIDNTGSK
jgi:hypothetical protein